MIHDARLVPADDPTTHEPTIRPNETAPCILT
jgi:hypothetical protein